MSTYRLVDYTNSMTKEQIQAEAVRIIAERGYDELSLSLLAESVNIKKASLYYYFKSKEELISSLYDSFSKEISHLGFSISFDQEAETVITTTFEHWKKIYTSKAYYPYLSLLYQRRDVDERAEEVSNSLMLMIRAQSEAIIDNLFLKHTCLVKDKELLSELFSSTSIFYLENGLEEGLFLKKFSALFLH